MDADRTSLSTSLGLPGGLTKVALTNASQLPSHIHSNTISVTLADHTHFTVGNSGNEKVLTSAYPIKIDELGSENENYRLAGTDLAGGANVGKTSASKSTVTATITNTAVGSSVAHDNMPPYIPCFYIMYRP
jgi:microcystin-dependent protein